MEPAGGEQIEHAQLQHTGRAAVPADEDEMVVPDIVELVERARPHALAGERDLGEVLVGLGGCAVAHGLQVSLARGVADHAHEVGGAPAFGQGGPAWKILVTWDVGAVAPEVVQAAHGGAGRALVLFGEGGQEVAEDRLAGAAVALGDGAAVDDGAPVSVGLAEVLELAVHGLDRDVEFAGDFHRVALATLDGVEPKAHLLAGFLRQATPLGGGVGQRDG